MQFSRLAFAFIELHAGSMNYESISKVFLNARAFKLDLFYKRDLLDIYVGADEHIIKEEDLSLLRLQDLSPLAVHSLDERLTKDQ